MLKFKGLTTNFITPNNTPGFFWLINWEICFEVKLASPKGPKVQIMPCGFHLEDLSNYKNLRGISQSSNPYSGLTEAKHLTNDIIYVIVVKSWEAVWN